MKSKESEVQNSDYAELKQRIQAAGLLERQYGYYVLKTIAALFFLAFGIVILALVDNIWLQLLNAAFWAFAFVQFGFFMHDAGHREIFKSVRKNDWFGLWAANLMVGLSASKWRDTHNEHHAAPNDEERDPDFNVKFLAYSANQAKESSGMMRLIIRYQAFFWIPLLSLQAFRLRLMYFAKLFTNLKERVGVYQVAEALLVLLHNILYFGIIFYFLSPQYAVFFIVVHHVVGGIYMGTVFATNHKGMPVLDRSSDFVRTQVLTARNVRSNFFLEWWCGGLQYQIEHHLFPTMPRNNLPKARLIVREFCAQKSIEYCETGFWESYRKILQHFHRVSAPLRT